MENNLVTIDNNGVAKLDKNVLSTIVNFEEQIKELKQKEDDLKSRILCEMEKKGIIKIETDELLINYIAPTSRETFDSKQLRSDNEDLYNSYIKLSNVKSSIRIKLK